MDWAPPVPGVVFLDSSVVIDLDRYGDYVWDGGELPDRLPAQQRMQIEALRILMALVARAGIACAVSSQVVRESKGQYVREVAEHWLAVRDAWELQDRGLPPMTVVATLPKKDQLVLAQAYRSGCQVILTNDLQWMRQTHRRTIAALGIETHTPVTLLEALRPWLSLWL